MIALARLLSSPMNAAEVVTSDHREFDYVQASKICAVDFFR